MNSETYIFKQLLSSLTINLMQTNSLFLTYEWIICVFILEIDISFISDLAQLSALEEKRMEGPPSEAKVFRQCALSHHNVEKLVIIMYLFFQLHKINYIVSASLVRHIFFLKWKTLIVWHSRRGFFFSVLGVSFRAVYQQFIDEMIIQPGSKNHSSERADVTMEDHVGGFQVFIVNLYWSCFNFALKCEDIP